MKKRDNSIDQFRGLAVVIMIASHSITYFSNSPTLSEFKIFLNSLAFISFLFISGAASYYSLNSKHQSIDKLIHRSLQIYLAFSLIGLIGLVFSGSLGFRSSFNLLILNFLPKFAEFLPTFLLFGLISYSLTNHLKHIYKSYLLTILVSCVSFLLGFYLYRLEVPDSLSIYKGYFAGHHKLPVFPVLQYFPVFLLGISTTHTLKSKPGQVNKYFKFLTGLLLTTLLIQALLSGANFNLLSSRFPPTLGFILRGSVFVLWGYLAVKILDRKNSLLEFWGKHSLEMLVIHVLLLFGYKRFTGWQTDSILVQIVLFFILIFLCTLIVRIYNRREIQLKL